MKNLKKVLLVVVMLLTVQSLNAQYWSNGSGHIYVNPTSLDVGIGTSNPQAKLHANAGSGQHGLRVQLNGSTRLWLQDNGGLSVGDFDDPPSRGLYVYGKVGIGTNSPASFANLDVRSNNDEAYIRVIGSGSTGNFSGINFTSDESTDKQWDLVHRKSPLNSFLFAYNDGSSWNNQMILLSNGNVGIGTTSPSEKLEVDGTTKTEVLEITGGSDLAESFHVNADIPLTPGMVVSIDPDNPGELRLASESYDKTVAGVISGANGIGTGLLLSQKESIADGDFPVAITGRVYCFVDASDAEVKPGDLLTTSNKPGYAMKADHYQKARGSVIGKAMTSLEKGESGLILVLITLQ